MGFAQHVHAMMIRANGFADQISTLLHAKAVLQNCWSSSLFITYRLV